MKGFAGADEAKNEKSTRLCQNPYNLTKKKRVHQSDGGGPLREERLAARGD